MKYSRKGHRHKKRIKRNGQARLVYFFDIKLPSLPTPSNSVFVSVVALSHVFHSINSPDNFPLSHSVFLVLLLPDWSFQLYISL